MKWHASYQIDNHISLGRHWIIYRFEEFSFLSLSFSQLRWENVSIRNCRTTVGSGNLTFRRLTIRHYDNERLFDRFEVVRLSNRWSLVMDNNLEIPGSHKFSEYFFFLSIATQNSNDFQQFMYLSATVLITTDLEKKIADAFLIFDHQGNKTVDVREIGTILRYLGCVPSENEINEIITATEFEDSNGAIHLSRFLPHVTQLLAEHKWVSRLVFFFQTFSLNKLTKRWIEWRQQRRRNYWRHFVFLMSMAKEPFHEIPLLS